jgi:disulfide oxidoreductase YuzD
MLRKLIFFVVLFSIYGCNYFTKKACGDISTKEKSKIEYLEKKYKLKIENIPCEYRYLNIYIDKIDMNDSSLNRVHKEIIDSKELNFHSIHVYDISNKNKLFEQYFNSYKEKFTRTNKIDNTKSGRIWK